jgi:DNA-binding response OmpR family regulator
VIAHDPELREYLNAVLRLAGARVTAAAAAEVGRAAVTADVIICDLTALDTGSPEDLARLQGHPAGDGREVPVIVVLPAGKTPDATATLAGFRHYLTRPLDGDTLCAAVRELARRA